MLPARPVLYLDLDDTLITWAGETPAPAPGATEFLRWALERFTVRWLTTWCPSGEMPPSLLADLCRMLEMNADEVRDIEGFPWEATGSKLNGIAWLEHLVLARPFLWIEDNYGVRDTELRFLAQHGLLHWYRRCNVTEDPEALRRLHWAMRREWSAGRFRPEVDQHPSPLDGDGLAAVGEGEPADGSLRVASGERAGGSTH